MACKASIHLHSACCTGKEARQQSPRYQTSEGVLFTSPCTHFVSYWKNSSRNRQLKSSDLLGPCPIGITLLFIGRTVCLGKDAEHSVDNVGTVPAALTTYLACQQYKPDLIISVGTAGGFAAQGAGIGDVFVGTTTVNHDRRIPIPVLQTERKGMLPFKAFHAAFLSLARYLAYLGPSYWSLLLLLNCHYRLAVPA